MNDGLTFPATAYLQRHFPETTKALFRREIVGWFSPTERYAIRKVFSDEFNLSASKVVRAELIDNRSGEVLCDLTRDDIGTGAHREGGGPLVSRLEAIRLCLERLDPNAWQPVQHAATATAKETNRSVPAFS